LRLSSARSTSELLGHGGGNGNSTHDGLQNRSRFRIGVLVYTGLPPNCVLYCVAAQLPKKIRQFKTGATRDTEAGKLDYEGFLSPEVLKAFVEYMNKHRVQSNGSLRPSDNWKKGIPKDVYMKSAWRHFMDWWSIHNNLPGRETMHDALAGVMFNVMGYFFEVLKEERSKPSPPKH